MSHSDPASTSSQDAWPLCLIQSPLSHRLLRNQLQPVNQARACFEPKKKAVLLVEAGLPNPGASPASQGSLLPFGDHCFLSLKYLTIGDNAADSNFHEKENKN